MANITVNRTEVGPGQPVYIVAEIGINHSGLPEKAHKLIDVAKDAGCNAVKFQVCDVNRLYSQKFMDREIYDIVSSTVLSNQDYITLRQHAKGVELDFFASFTDSGSLDIVLEVGTDALKIAATQFSNMPLMKKVAQTGLPVILSTGMHTIDEIRKVVEFCRTFNENIIVLYCVAKYPTPIADIYLSNIDILQQEFPSMPVGLSDHTFENVTSLMALSHQIALIEKHITLDRTSPLPGDHFMSLEPGEVKALVKEVRMAEQLLAQTSQAFLVTDRESAKEYRQGIFAKRTLQAGTVIQEDDMFVARPILGISSVYFYDIIDRSVKTTIAENNPLTWEDLNES